MRNGRQVWTDEDLVAPRRRVRRLAAVPPVRVIARMLFAPRQLYRWTRRPRAPARRCSPASRRRIREVGPTASASICTLPRGLQPCAEFFLLDQGRHRRDAAHARPEPRQGADGGSSRTAARYDITLSAGRRHAVVRPPRGHLALLAAGGGARAQRGARGAADARYKELDEARDVLALQATQLSVAHTISQLIHGDLDVDRTLAGDGRGAGQGRRLRCGRGPAVDGGRRQAVRAASPPRAWRRRARPILRGAAVARARHRRRARLARAEHDPRERAAAARVRAADAVDGARQRHQLSRAGAVPRQPRAARRRAHRRADAGARPAGADRAQPRGGAGGARSHLRQHQPRDPHAADAGAAGGVRPASSASARRSTRARCSSSTASRCRRASCSASSTICCSWRRGARASCGCNISAVDLAPMLERGRGDLAAGRRSRRASPSRFSGPARCVRHVDEEKIERVVTNLISNAIKFTPSGGSIQVDLTRGRGRRRHRGARHRHRHRRRAEEAAVRPLRAGAPGGARRRARLGHRPVDRQGADRGARRRGLRREPARRRQRLPRAPARRRRAARRARRRGRLGLVGAAAPGARRLRRRRARSRRCRACSSRRRRRAPPSSSPRTIRA